MLEDKEHKEIAGALLSSLADAHIHPDRINFVIFGEGSTVVAAAKHVLQHVWRNTDENPRGQRRKRPFHNAERSKQNWQGYAFQHAWQYHLGPRWVWTCGATAAKPRRAPPDQTQPNMTHTHTHKGGVDSAY